MYNTKKRAYMTLRIGLSVAILFVAAACAATTTPAPSNTPATEATVQTGQTPGATATATATATPTATAPPTAMPTQTPTPAPEAASDRTNRVRATVNDRTAPSRPVKLRNATIGKDLAMPIPDKPELKYPNLGSRLDGLVASVEAGEATPQEAAADTPLHSGDSVAVTVYLSGKVDELIAFLEENDSEARNAGEDYVEAYVPVILLGPLSERPGVIRVREIVPPQPAQGG